MTRDDLNGLIANRVPEASSLEYKSQLPITSPKERMELLKDLTGMANGGGGTVIYGMDEDRVDDWPVAKAFTALTDRGLPARIENICRDGVRPPLLAAMQLIEVHNGYVLAVEVEPSPLGPYMVELRGDRRHYVRQGTSAVAMTEQQVRDAYALAVRGSEHRSQVWEQHALPLREPGLENEPWLVVSAVPQEPFVDVLNMSVVEPADLQPPEAMATYINNWSLGDLTPTIASLTRWVEGFHGREHDHLGLKDVMRLHRDGSAAVAARINRFPVSAGYAEAGEMVIDLTYVARVAKTFFLYLGWFWCRFDLPRQVELRLDLRNIATERFVLGHEGRGPKLSRPISGPVGVPVDHVSISEYVLPWELGRASARHLVLMRFCDRLCQAGGDLRAGPGFRRGRLHDRDGINTDVVVGGGVIYDLTTHIQQATIGADGSIRSGTSGSVVGWYDEGVVMDREGQAVAVLEFAPGAGCPDDFIGQRLHVDADGAWQLAPTPFGQGSGEAQPNPTRTWSPSELRTMLEGR